MVYLSKKEADELSRAIPKSRNKEITKIINKLKSPPKNLSYVNDEKKIKSLLRKAFNEKRKVKINYYSLSSDEVTNRVIGIYQFHDDCVVAYCNLRKGERTFVIGRI